MDALATTFDAQLPEWVVERVASIERFLPDVESRMEVVNTLADKNYRMGTGGPFAAMVADWTTGEVLSVGVNLVLASGLSGLHAEVVALSLAHVRLGSWDLGGPGCPRAELLVNWRPCAMCFGAVHWSGVERLVIAGEGDDLERLTGYDEGPMRSDWKEQLDQRGISVRTDVLRQEAVRIFRSYGERTDVIRYSPRRHRSSAGIHGAA